VTAVDPIAQLTGVGGAFEIVVDDVLGHPMQVYKKRMRSLRELMAQNVARADVDWVVQDDRRFTYGEHDRLARVLAASLARLGVRRGDRVALVSANVPEWVVTWWACAILGATLVPLNAWWKAEELEFGLSDSGSKVLIGDARRVALVRDRIASLPELLHVFVIDGPADAAARSFDELIDDPGDPGMPESPIDEDDVLAILYTSGTTGKPKGATVSHRQAIANVQNIIVMGVAQAMRGTPPPKPRPVSSRPRCSSCRSST
jgi:long-chain acyl-CoA synthetase